MRRVLLFLLAVLGLPLAWGLGEALLRGLAADVAEGPLLTSGRLWFLGGAVAMTLLYAWKGRALMVAYVFAHEMTHAVVGLLCLARVHRVSVRETGGFVELSKQNLAIVLAPYCVPFYLLLAVAARALTAWLWPGALPDGPWLGLFGVLTLFHALYTLDALISVAQPDIREYGRLFSYWLIVCVNLFFASVALTFAGRVGAFAQGRRILSSTAHAYAALWTGGVKAIRRISSHPSIPPKAQARGRRSPQRRAIATLRLGRSIEGPMERGPYGRQGAKRPVSP